jgi:hypothetical protein
VVKKEWRDVVRDDFRAKNAHQKNVFIEDLGVARSNLERWLSKDTKPRPANVQKLAELYPEIIEELRVEFPEAFIEKEIKEPTEPRNLVMPRAYYKQLSAARATTAPSMYDRTLNGLFFEFVKSQLDPKGAGFLILPVLCLSPDASGKVKKLQVQDGGGTGPWTFKRLLAMDPTKEPFYCGRECLSGMAVMERQSILYPEQYVLTKTDAIKAKGDIHSAVAVPIAWAGRIAGALFYASMQEHFFTPARIDLCVEYADEYAVLLHSDHFYSTEHIELEYLDTENGANEENGG